MTIGSDWRWTTTTRQRPQLGSGIDRQGYRFKAIENVNSGESASAIQFNSLARSLALCQRSSGSFATHFLTARCRNSRAEARFDKLNEDITLAELEAVPGSTTLTSSRRQLCAICPAKCRKALGRIRPGTEATTPKIDFPRRGALRRRFLSNHCN